MQIVMYGKIRAGVRLYILLMIIAFLAPAGCGGDNYWEELSSSQNNSSMAVLAPGIHVSGSGSDITGDGSIGNPYRTIFTGLGEAVSRGLTRVYVADGTYTVDDITGPLVLIEGISIFGGFRSDFDAYDPAAYIAVIDNTQTTVGGGALGTPRTTIWAGAGITNTTMLSGFTVNGGSGANFVSGIACIGGSPSISRNIIYGGTPAANQSSYGVIITGTSSPDIYNNQIYGDNSGTGQSSTGIYITITGAGMTIRNNTITSGNASNVYGIQIRNSDSTLSMIILRNSIAAENGINEAYGIYSESSDPEIAANSIDGGSGQYTRGIYYIGLPVGPPGKIYNNTIYGGDGTIDVHGILLSSSDLEIYNNTINGGGSSTSTTNAITLYDSAPYINNNLIYATDGIIQYGIIEMDSTSDPMEVLNNDIFNCTTALYRDEDITNITLIADVNDQFFTTQRGAGTAAGNVEIDVTAFFGTDYLINTYIVGVTDGGLDGWAEGWGFDTDKNGILRTVPWSMGAYEYD